jgi:hypothetical protein
VREIVDWGIEIVNVDKGLSDVGGNEYPSHRSFLGGSLCFDIAQEHQFIRAQFKQELDRSLMIVFASWKHWERKRK